MFVLSSDVQGVMCAMSFAETDGHMQLNDVVLGHMHAHIASQTHKKTEWGDHSQMIQS